MNSTDRTEGSKLIKQIIAQKDKIRQLERREDELAIAIEQQRLENLQFKAKQLGV